MSGRAPAAGGGACTTASYARAPDHLLDEALSPAALAELPPGARGENGEIAHLVPVDVSSSEGTRHQYRRRFTLFVAWCTARGLRALPAHPEVLRLYVAWLGAKGHAWATVRGSHAAVLATHRALGYPAPASERLRAALHEVRRVATIENLAHAISPVTLRAIVATCGSDTLALRDRALLLVTYFARLLPMESVALDRESAERGPDGYVLKLPVRGPGKTEVLRLELPLQHEPELCPVRALDQWLDAYERAANLRAVRGPLFVAIRGGRGYPVAVGRRISARSVERVLRRRAAVAGIDETSLSVDGLRAGAAAVAMP